MTHNASQSRRLFTRALGSAFAVRPARRAKLKVEALEDRVTPVTVGFSSATSTINPEGTPPGGGGGTNVLVVLDAVAPTDVTVQVSTGGGTATPGIDYFPLTNY